MFTGAPGGRCLFETFFREAPELSLLSLSLVRFFILGRCGLDRGVVHLAAVVRVFVSLWPVPVFAIVWAIFKPQHALLTLSDYREKRARLPPAFVLPLCILPSRRALRSFEVLFAGQRDLRQSAALRNDLAVILQCSL